MEGQLGKGGRENASVISATIEKMYHIYAHTHTYAQPPPTPPHTQVKNENTE